MMMGKSLSRTKRVIRSFTMAIEKSAAAPSLVCIPPEDIKQTSGNCWRAHSTNSLQNFSALAISKAPAWKSKLETKAPTRFSSPSMLKLPKPVITPQGVIPLFNACSIELRKPGKWTGSADSKLPLISLKLVKNFSINAGALVFFSRFTSSNTRWINKSW